MKDTNLYAHPESQDRRAALTRELRAATGLSEAVLEAFLRDFYDAARRDPLLGPAFAGVPDWEAHIARITQFWCSVALMAGTYHGQPLQAHAHLGLGAPHFARWLALFEETAAARLSPVGTAHLMDRARRIAASLEMGLTPLPLPKGTHKGNPA